MAAGEPQGGFVQEQLLFIADQFEELATDVETGNAPLSS
jgi:hypothetical protein